MKLTMDLIHGFQAKHEHGMKDLTGVGFGFGLSANPHLLVIKLPDSKGLKLVAKTMLLALIIAAFPWLISIIRGSTTDFQRADSELQAAFGTPDMEILPLLFHDLANEGLLKTGDKALLVSRGNDEIVYDSQVLSNNGIEFFSYSDLEKQSSIPNESFDFAFTHDFVSTTEVIDRTLRVGGIATFQFTKDPFMGFHNPSNYKIVYLRQFESTNIVAVQKISNSNTNSPAKRRLFGVTNEAKRDVLKNLEDVLLEPPRASSRRSKSYLKRTRYLPDLLGDSLESYPRRVFIDVGLSEKGGSTSHTEWFAKHYPTRKKNFEMYKIETVEEEFSGKAVPPVGMSDWLKRNVREEEYVVMKAEAEVVEEMVKNNALELVDELFLECKHQGLKGKSKKSRRAYWECLALYGRLRDEGVAVHQWWG